jgi:hypothetical protein
LSLHVKTIEGREVSFGKVGAIEGWKLIHQLTKVLSPALDGLGKGDVGGAIGKAMGNLSADELIGLIRALTADVLVDGKKFSNTEMADYGFTLLVVVESVKYNFGGFFSPIQQGLNGSGLAAKEKG